jgi:UDP-2,4-diacetamido-2,4,6-trideoxy-beta-L-altropyranose hydrolase
MKNIVFRVDSGTHIGSGHVMRCITLALQLKQKEQVNCFFITREHKGHFNEVIIKHGLKVICLKNSDISNNMPEFSKWLGTSQQDDVNATQQALLFHEIDNIELLIVDHYALDIYWETKFKSYCNKLIVIDDLANRKHYCDILLDQNLAPNYLTRYDLLTPKNCKKFLGITYCLLQDDFARLKSSVKVRNKMENLLIFFGGVDKDNATFSLLNVLKEKFNLFKTINVVVGRSNPNKTLIESFCNKYKNLKYHEQIPSMAKLMLEADISIGAGGATTGERIFLGLPSILFSVAENQKSVAEYLEKRFIIKFLGDQKDITNGKVITEIENHANNPNALKKNSIKLIHMSQNKSYKFIDELLCNYL